ncbi:MAG: hypothetical protein HYW95_02875 [Candidatus Wildermuthbacteria bacterium]|nr:hypothetical protein [Candidatus Wildermuthbacteria bacterium]
MKLFEYEGKKLFEKYGIPVPKGVLLTMESTRPLLAPPLALKAQVLAGERKARGGVLFVEDMQDFEKAKRKLFETTIDGETPSYILAEERIQAVQELYVSFSYDTESRGPILAISAKGGTGIAEAQIIPIDIALGLPDFLIRNALLQAQLPLNSSLIALIKSLWRLFIEEKAILAEINPLFVVKEGVYVAGDAKIILDDNVMNPLFRPFLDLDGDIAVLASGGGASLINLDALLYFGGKPANYVEYSGNPPASVVEELTVRVFSKPGLKGCWVVGGTANFTDIYETMLGFVQGLRKIQPKPTFPIVIRRDGPRQKEGFEMLREVAKNEGYNFHLYGPELPMSETARIMVELAYKK